MPGGRVHKNERLVEAVHRVARSELGVDVTIDERLGTYEHFYDAADVAVDTGKHYVATAFVVDAPDEDLGPETQHEDLRRFEAIPEDAHEYVAAYLEDAGFDRGE